MPELPWLPEYSGETTDELIGLEGRFRTDSIVVAFEQAIDQKAHRLGGGRALSEEERTVLAVEALEREVNNGGYDAFLSNTDIDILAEIVGALKRIGRDDVAQLTQRAIDIFDAAADERLGSCDDEYFRTAGDLAIPLFEFIKASRANIGLP
jgi:hypothetical protein